MVSVPSTRVLRAARLCSAPRPSAESRAFAIGVYLNGDMVDGESQFFPFVNIKLAGSYTIARALKRALR